MKKGTRMAAVGVAFALTAAGLAGCGSVNSKNVELETAEGDDWMTLKSEADPEVTTGEFERIELKWNEGEVEMLSLPQSSLLSRGVNLGILKLEDGRYYSLGHGVSGDGSKSISMAVFGFDGTLMEDMGPEEGIMLSSLKDPIEPNVYHYYRYMEGISQFVRADFSSFTQEVLVEWNRDENVISWADYYAFDQESLYHLKSTYGPNGTDTSIYKHRFAGDDPVIELIEADVDQNDLREISMDKAGRVHILTKNRFITVDQNGKHRVEFDFKPVGRDGATLYFVDEDGYFSAFETGSDKEDQQRVRRIGKINTDQFDNARYRSDYIKNGFCYYVDRGNQLVALDLKEGEGQLMGHTEGEIYEPIHLGAYAAVNPYGDDTIYLWDTAKKELAFRMEAEGLEELWQRDGRYLFCKMEDRLWILDVEEKKFYETALGEEFDNFQFFDGEYLYGRMDGDWAYEPEAPDRYYRVKGDVCVES